jgi:hypothetical protein
LVSSLYTDVLIEPANAPGKKESFRFLGKNQKNILLLVSKDNVAFLEDEELSFLSSILSACKLSVADCAIVNLKTLGEPVTFSSLIAHFNSRSVLLFDVTPESIDLPFHFPHFQLQPFNSCVYLSAPSLKELEKEKPLKTKLWNCLKTLFAL